MIRTERATARALLALPRPVLSRLVGRRKQIDDAPLDEQAQLLLAAASVLRKTKPEEVPVADARRDMHHNLLVLAPEAREMARVTDHECGTFSLRVYEPRTRNGQGGVLYIHGGGFVCGDVAGYDPFCRYLADESRCVVASLEYRLAPEHKFPAGIEDALAAFRWLHDRATDFGIDPDKIAVVGDSAGGNFAAVVSLETRGGPAPVLQILIYPGVDMTCSGKSHELFAKGFFLEQSTIDFYIDSYLSSAAQKTDPRASPLFARDVHGVSPAMIITAGFDPLRDGGLAYADKLESAGVRVIRRHDPGMFHGYIATAGVITVGREAVDEITRVLRDELR